MSLFPHFPVFWPLRYNFEPFFQMFNEMQCVSDSFSYDISSPNFDVKEEKDTYILQGKVSGIDHKDIIIEFGDDQNLIIKGRTEHSGEEGQRPGTVTGSRESGGSTSDGRGNAHTNSREVAHSIPQHTYWLSERSTGGFARGFSFPTRIDQGNVKASLENGILSVVLPKLA